MGANIIPQCLQLLLKNTKRRGRARRDYSRRFEKLLIKEGRMEKVEVEEEGWWKFRGES